MVRGRKRKKENYSKKVSTDAATERNISKDKKRWRESEKEEKGTRKGQN